MTKRSKAFVVAVFAAVALDIPATGCDEPRLVGGVGTVPAPATALIHPQPMCDPNHNPAHPWDWC